MLSKSPNGEVKLFIRVFLKDNLLDHLQLQMM